MKRQICLLGVFLCLPAATACQPLPQAVQGNWDGAQRISITAEAGSEIVITKYGDTGAGATQLPSEITPLQDPDAAFAFLPAARVEVDPPLPKPEIEHLPLPSAGPVPLGTLRAEPWRVRAGETLIDAVRRFAQREGYTVRKPDPYPIWQITADAEYEGVFDDALLWLMRGFAHVDPHPILTLHPNRVIRLATE